MANKYVGMVSFEADGRLADAVEVTPNKKEFRKRVETMSKSGYVEMRPQYGLTIKVVENNNFSENPFWEDMTNGTLVIVYTNGKREVYSRAVCLGVDHTGYSTNGEAMFTYEFMSAKPTKS